MAEKMASNKNFLKLIITFSLIILFSLSLGFLAYNLRNGLGEQNVIGQQQNIPLENILKGNKEKEQFVYESQEKSLEWMQSGELDERKTQAGVKESKLTVSKLRKNGDLQKKFQEAFPELAAAYWGVIEVYNEEVDIILEYFVVPLWFSETFIIDHQNTLSYMQQRDKILEIDSLSMIRTALIDSVMILERLYANAYNEGYSTGNQLYNELLEEYILELEK